MISGFELTTIIRDWEQTCCEVQNNPPWLLWNTRCWTLWDRMVHWIGQRSLPGDQCLPHVTSNRLVPICCAGTTRALNFTPLSCQEPPVSFCFAEQREADVPQSRRNLCPLRRISLFLLLLPLLLLLHPKKNCYRVISHMFILYL